MKLFTNWTEPEDIREAIDILTPVDPDFAMPLVQLLTEHGAQLEQRDSFKHMVKEPDNTYTEKVATNYNITFPEGTTRHDGLVWGSSRRFRIVFPDSFELRGLDQWSMTGGDKTFIFLPKASDE